MRESLSIVLVYRPPVVPGTEADQGNTERLCRVMREMWGPQVWVGDFNLHIDWERAYSPVAFPPTSGTACWTWLCPTGRVWLQRQAQKDILLLEQIIKCSTWSCVDQVLTITKSGACGWLEQGKHDHWPSWRTGWTGWTGGRKGLNLQAEAEWDKFKEILDREVAAWKGGGMGANHGGWLGKLWGW